MKKWENGMRNENYETEAKWTREKSNDAVDVE